MKYADLKDMSQVELKKKKAALRNEMFEMKMKNQLGQLSNPVSIRGVRKDLARIETALKGKA